MVHRRVLPLVVAAALAPAAVPAGAAAAPCAGAARAATAGKASAANATLCLLNAQRAKHRLRPLRLSAPLGRAAAGHSRAMVRGRFFAHGDFFGRIVRAGYLRGARSYTVGENIAWGGGPVSSPASIVRMWMHSPPHRANILNGRFRDIGIGIALGTPTGAPGGTYTTDFGARR